MNRVPEKAFILAAGLGKHLHPLTSTMPGALMPLWNCPLIDHTLCMLKRYGVKEVVVNTHWLSEMLTDHLTSNDYNIAIHISHEKNLLGTGGALAAWRDFFAEAPFWVVNGDIAASFDMNLLALALSSAPRSVGACWITDQKGPRTVEVDYAGRITCYRSPDPGISGTYTYCGAQLLSPLIFDYIKAGTFSTLIEVYEEAMFDNHFMKGINISESYWNYAENLAHYRDIHMETKQLALTEKPGGELYDSQNDRLRENRSSFFCVGSGAQVAADVRGKRSIVFDGVTLEEGTSLKNSILQGGVLSGEFNHVTCINGSALSDTRIKNATEALGWNSGESAFAFLGQRGSNRSFWRGFNRDQRAIFLADDQACPENSRYAGYTEILKQADVPVPELLYVSTDLSTLVLEDMGTASLADKVVSDPGNIENLYQGVLKQVAVFHRGATRIVESEAVELEATDNDQLFEQERDLFERHILMERFGYDAMPADVCIELEGVAEALKDGHAMVIHSDLRSGNILFKGGRGAFINYQGMRYGSPACDIASLLYDPYVKIDVKLRCKLAAEYAAMLPECPDLITLFFNGAVQSLVHSLGTLGRISVPSHSSVQCYILPALESLLEVADAAELDALGALAEELIARENLRLGG